MAAPVETGLVYNDLAGFPDDNLRRELIGGDLFVTPAPRTRHQAVVRELLFALTSFAKERGGQTFTAPLDVLFTDEDVVEPDLVHLTPDHLDRIEERFVRGAPDIVIEVSSPSTRSFDLGRKRDLYERHGVGEYWFVDLDADRIDIHQLDEDGRYRTQTRFAQGDVLTSSLLPGFELAVSDVLSDAGSSS